MTGLFLMSDILWISCISVFNSRNWFRDHVKSLENENSEIENLTEDEWKYRSTDNQFRSHSLAIRIKATMIRREKIPRKIDSSLSRYSRLSNR